MPFGGVGYSGMGKSYGKVGFDALSNTKAMLIGNPDLDLDVFLPTPARTSQRIRAFFRKEDVSFAGEEHWEVLSP
jgi:hypothetical protein